MQSRVTTRRLGRFHVFEEDISILNSLLTLLFPAAYLTLMTISVSPSKCWLLACIRFPREGQTTEGITCQQTIPLQRGTDKWIKLPSDSLAGKMPSLEVKELGRASDLNQLTMQTMVLNGPGLV